MNETFAFTAAVFCLYGGATVTSIAALYYGVWEMAAVVWVVVGLIGIEVDHDE